MTYSQPQQPQMPRPQRDVWHKFFAFIRDSYIVRSENRIIAGVCDGFARRFGLSVVLVRVLLAISVLFAGFGFVIYGLAWLLLPEEITGRILLQDVLNGQWTAEIVVPAIVAALAILIPIAGWFAAFVAVIAMYVVISYSERQVRLQGMPTQAGQAQSTQTSQTGQSQSQSTQTQFTQASQDQPIYPNMFAPQQTYQQQSYQTPPYQAQSYAQTYIQSYTQSAGTPAGASAGTPTGTTASTPVGAPAGTGASSPVVPQRVTVRARRKPAGPALVLCTLGVIALAIASSVIIGMKIADGTLSWRAWDVATVASGIVCLIMGITIVVLGIRGRRAGGLIPLAMIVGFVTFTNMSVAAIHNFEVADMLDRSQYARVITIGKSHSGQPTPFGTVLENGNLTVKPTSANDDIMHKLSNHVLFVGDSINESHVTLDLTEIGTAHKLDLQTGDTVNSLCPVGQYKISVINAKVTIRLPYGCSYGFGEGDYYMQESVISTRSSYAIDNGGAVVGWLNDFTSDMAVDSQQFNGKSSLDFVLPTGHPELLFNVDRAYNAVIDYDYASESSGSNSGYESFKASDYVDDDSSDANDSADSVDSGDSADSGDSENSESSTNSPSSESSHSSKRAPSHHSDSSTRN